MPVHRLHSSVKQHPEQSSCLWLSEESSESRTVDPVAPCFSAAIPLLSSLPATPCLDPRNFEIEVEFQSDEQAPFQLETPNCNKDELDPNEEKPDDTIQLNSPTQSFINPSSMNCSGTNTNVKPATSANTEHIIILGSNSAKGIHEEHSQLQGNTDDKNSNDDQTNIGDVCRPFIRAKARARLYVNNVKNPDTPKLRHRLNKKEKRKLFQLKDQSLTLRQIGLHFTEIEPAALRQAWKAMEVPQRCTRSRAHLMCHRRSVH
ncbi:hypothetical protein N7495_007659 [Penicillium taxi]|uniref:uncharacterized protein n=1 Tax=Penicillium taxi TaxID=168475 RepID=UPI00254530E1|nr:uncharacterized protein N7495_007659 [Penicillium taxi]KAJ5887618.1 hypothetical protein N7495_007659 [Penicillium taxi]